VKGKESSPAAVDIKLKGNGYSGPGTNVNGIVEAVGTPASLQLTFKSAGAFITNGLGGYIIPGTFNGTVKSGVPVIDSLTGNGKVKNSAAVLDIFPWNITQFEAGVVQVGDKLYAQSDSPIYATGSGKVSGSKKANLSFKGIGSEKGSSWKLDGTSSVIPVGSTNNTVKLFSTAELTAKLYGQQFKRTCVVTAAPIDN
jgi:hypothetical protein